VDGEWTNGKNIMAAIRTIKNQYRGINAHLHSYWQADSRWAGFHTVQIGDLYKTLSNALAPLGYDAEIEESLQIRRIDGSARHPRSDVLVFDPDPLRPRVRPPVSSPTVQRISALELLAEDTLSEKPYRAVVIYELTDSQAERGEPVAWIELLSPSNKMGDDADLYHAKRASILNAGLVFIEIDYLHETAPTFSALPRYRKNGTSSLPFEPHAYRIVVIDPRPYLAKGWAEIYPMNVDDPFPLVDIPLNGNDALRFDFALPYQKSFEEGSYGKRIDYSSLPHNFDRYSAADQTRIARRMVTVLSANDAEREQPPLVVDESLSLEEALEKIQTFSGA
jgi:hypothetical protein